jgi:hypothetical protein
MVLSFYFMNLIFVNFIFFVQEKCRVLNKCYMLLEAAVLIS